ncbi:uncharacterized protein LOC135692247 isoform X1 [Rhopilema esculentum]|uniref:uncharacterized protein LOC135692247 isoform X1 n=1 Tax=Rhopilema esculentum TaxID=499914 RepID=UPI0031D3C11B
MSTKKSNNQEDAATKKAGRGLQQKSVQMASKNPFAACKSYYDKPRPANEKIPFSWQDTQYQDRSKSADEAKFRYLEKQYTRGVVGSSNSSINGDIKNQTRFLSAPVSKRDQQRSSERPTSPTPGISVPSEEIRDKPVEETRSIPRGGSRDAQPQEWTKQRMHENNMEWRAGYENWRGRAAQIHNNMARELGEIARSKETNSKDLHRKSQW